MKYLFVFALICSLFTSCNTIIENEKDIADIKGLLEQERRAHFSKDAGLFASEFALGMYSVNKGIVSQLPKEEHTKRIQNYFNEVKFIKWDDIEEPIIEFSDDHTLAYAIAQKRVILETKDSTGKLVQDTTDFAWTSIYRKQENEWKIECNISTNK